MKQEVRLSQCMIVKNEEKNIRRALSWGKGVVCEQIVVDTGSTDDTVKIAEEMGAKIYHFDWINDFSAAKNYAIEQAAGNWIAFLDADEYFSEEDAERLYQFLEKVEGMPAKERPNIIGCPLLNLDDSGEIFAAGGQQRVFRNLPKLRYHNKIHEMLRMPAGYDNRIVTVSDLSIYHTGYSSAAYEFTDKAGRNVELLRKELEEQPENYSLWSYLADSLSAGGDSAEAMDCLKKVMPHLDEPWELESRKRSACDKLLMLYAKNFRKEEQQEMAEGYEAGASRFPEDPDLDYYRGLWHIKAEQWQKGTLYLEKGLSKLEELNQKTAGFDSNMAGDLKNTYSLLALAYDKLKNKQQFVRYAVLSLRADRYQQEVLVPLLRELKNDMKPGDSMETIWKFLGGLYQLEGLRDKLHILRAAKQSGFLMLQWYVREHLTEEERAWLEGAGETNTLDEDELSKRYPQVTFRNETDSGFVKLIQELEEKSVQELVEQMTEKLDFLRSKEHDRYQKYVDYHQKFPFWGALQPGKKVYEVFEKRAELLTGHTQELLNFYGRLEDYRSKRVLPALLENWLRLDCHGLAEVKENGPEYYDLDLLPSMEGKIIVDGGASAGDTVKSLIRIYGMNYKRICCYESLQQAAQLLEEEVKKYPDVTVRRAALSGEKGELYVHENQEDIVVSTVSAQESEEPVEAVTLDEELEEPVDFIKLNLAGGECAALNGCREQIRKNHPALAVSLFYHYEDLWVIPALIDEIAPGYRFYLRYYGGEALTTEYVLYGLWDGGRQAGKD